MRLIKAGIIAAIIMLFVIIHFIDPTFLPHIWGLLARGDIEETASFIASFGYWAILFSFLLTLFVNALGFPPAIIFSTANTLIFGIFWGIVLSVAAETVGVTFSFILLRFFFRGTAQKIINKNKTLANIDKYSGKRGFAVMLIARMVPYFPSIMLNAIGALSAMRLSDYVIASLIGKVPSTGIEAIIGHDTITKQEDPTRLIVVVVLAILLIAGAWYYEKQAAKKHVDC
ncbi:MAG: TVP38/TMEM64 family protein [Selenomonas sp.]|nr:TVP38/TMEM64 family protein [Selenomonadales bacterium]MDD7763406.1 TVP38/TMEM64 family protein [Selenomonadales bacterium]MDY5717604.1 TVP38/TMEM64 family protein [Selenomonas sp.]